MRSYRIAYTAALVIAIIVFVGTNTPLALAAVVLLVLMLVSCLLASGLMAGSATLQCTVHPSCQVGQPLNLDIVVNRPTYLPVGRIECLLTCRNVMRNEVHSIPVVLSAGQPGTAQFALPLDTQTCGRTEITIDRMLMYDPLALSKHAKDVAFSAAYSVYPRMLDLSVALERSPRANTSGTTYDPKRRGQDRSEPFELRDYRESDPMHAIHWKLSTKLDKLVVREASHPSNYDILVLVDLGCASGTHGQRTPDNVIAGILDLTASISFDLCRRGLGHNVALRDGDHLADAMVDSIPTYEDMLDLLISTPMPATAGVDVSLFNWYRREHSFTKTVLITSDAGQNLLRELGRSTDLSVLYVAAGSEAVIDDAETYSLTSIPLEAMEDHVRSVVI